MSEERDRRREEGRCPVFTSFLLIMIAALIDGDKAQHVTGDFGVSILGKNQCTWAFYQQLLPFLADGRLAAAVGEANVACLSTTRVNTTGTHLKHS